MANGFFQVRQRMVAATNDSPVCYSFDCDRVVQSTKFGVLVP